MQQLKTHMHAIDELRHQLGPGDQVRFTGLTKQVRCDVQRAIEEYGMVQSKLNYDESQEKEQEPFDDLTTISDQSVLIPREEAAVQSWEELKHVCCT